MSTLRDGLIKRGNSWSFVIRMTDARTGMSKPKWVRGFATEAEAKEARDSARVAARQGAYVDKNRITVKQYLEEWLDAHAMEIKPATLATYRYLVKHYVNVHIGHMRLQAVRPTTLSGLYRDLLVHGGKGGRPAAQLRTFLDAASPHRLSAFFRVAAYSGARRGELCNLRWADVDWNGPSLGIKGSVGVIAGERIEGTTKSGRERI